MAELMPQLVALRRNDQLDADLDTLRGLGGTCGWILEIARAGSIRRRPYYRSWWETANGPLVATAPPDTIAPRCAGSCVT